MQTFLCNNRDWLFSEEAFSFYSACMYKPTYEKYKERMEKYISDASVKTYVCETDRKSVGMADGRFQSYVQIPHEERDIE